MKHIEIQNNALEWGAFPFLIMIMFTKLIKFMDEGCMLSVMGEVK